MVHRSNSFVSFLNANGNTVVSYWNNSGDYLLHFYHQSLFTSSNPEIPNNLGNLLLLPYLQKIILV